MLKKQCAKCKRVKEAIAFSKNKYSKDGLQSYCKSCRKLDRAANREKTSNYFSEWRKQNPQYHKNYREENRDRISVYLNDYRKKNKGTIKKQRREYRQKHRETLSDYDRQYRIDNPEKVRERNRKQRARRKEQVGQVFPKMERSLFWCQRGLCFYCNVDLKDTGYHLDHMLPLSRGGLHCWTNTCLTCPTCNLRKSSRTAEEFMEKN